jgi:hypothetical protein
MNNAALIVLHYKIHQPNLEFLNEIKDCSIFLF